ncbi:TPA: hypothetical protein ACGOYL_000867 [Streptococcus suis]|uniref:SuB0782 undefined product 764400:764714 forward MW:11955 n=3 Tax=Streptococcus suis TaxID=1307 RepID=A0A0M9FIV6_STRSU|nr:hypothetical protein [Streptococcus suis]AZR98430.1 hypothetical protein A7J10_11670 [Streptococcus suis]KPA68382.1 hypothetical protein XK27_02610 [Streptococcus suis]MBO4126970.1 hypothetical protein [Streptococcus suis]MBY4970513.1 hypothetical protein [Streptococcus suis]MBY5017989.1 hypothetical protein [Streptococcus suis]
MTFKFKTKSGYSNQLFIDIFGNIQTAIALSPQAEVRMKYVDNAPTNEIDSYRYWFVIEGQQPFEVKFSNPQNIEQFDEIKFENPEACNVRGNIYFRANSATVIKKGGK